MKKCAIFLLLALLIFGLAACAREETTYERTVNGETYLIDSKNQTLTHEGAVYTYTLPKLPEGVSFQGGFLRVIYPDGTWYEREIDDDGNLGLSYEKTSSNYDEKTYPRGEDLCYALEKEALRAAGADEPEREDGTGLKIAMCILFVGAGVINLIFPGLGHHLKYSLWVKDAEPTDFALEHSRFMGVILIAVGIGVLILM